MIDQSTIDRVARAIYIVGNPVIRDTWWDMLCSADLSKDYFPERYRKMARAAIEAMETPGE